MAKRLILIDVAGAFRANWHASEHQEVGEAYARTISKVYSLAQGYDLCAVCCDWPPYRRSQIYPEYKAHRSAPPEVMVEQFRRVKERLKADGFVVWQVAGYEADDLLATAATIAVDRDKLEVTIASSDKDLLRMVSDDMCVRVVSIASGEVYDQLAVVNKFGVAPRMMADLLALTGDKADGIPGIPGVGTKRAAELLNAYGNALNVVECAGDIPGKLGEAVRAHGSKVALALQLVTLETDVPIDWDAIYVERKATPTQPEEENMSAIDDEFENDLAGSGEVYERENNEPTSSPRRDAVPPEPMPQPPKQTQLARREPEPDSEAQSIVPVRVEYNQALEPQTMGQAYKLARGLFESRLYMRFPNPEAVWAVIMRGREMGIGALTALDAFHVIEGRPSPSAHFIIARAKAHPDCEYFQCLETSATSSTWETKNKHNAKPTRLTYTIEEAAQAGLTRRGGNWTARPAEMLRKTCGVQLARIEYPDAALGLFCPEEMGADSAA